jgi:hypothetical protein
MRCDRQQIIAGLMYASTKNKLQASKQPLKSETARICAHNVTINTIIHDLLHKRTLPLLVAASR